MDELIVSNEEEYYNLAYQIATNTKKYNKLKLALKNNIKSSPLFNTKKYVKNFEKALQLAFENKLNKGNLENIVV